MTSWWNNNINHRLNDFKAWVGTSDQPSKKYCRNYIIFQGYKNVLDCGCGLSTDYEYFKDNNIDYTGLDSCQYFVDINKRNGIKMIEAELESDLPILNDSYDCIYCREVLEHLSYYEKALNEMIRISSHEIIVVFFIKPHSEEDKINYWQEEDLYHNTYNKEKLELFLTNNSKVHSFFWKDIDDEPYHVEPLPVLVQPDLTEDAGSSLEGQESIEQALPEELMVQSISEPLSEEVSNNVSSELPPPVEVEKPTGEKIVLHIILKKS